MSKTRRTLCAISVCIVARFGWYISLCPIRFDSIFHPWKQCIRQHQQRRWWRRHQHQQQRQQNTDSLLPEWMLLVYRGVSVQYGFGINVALIFSVSWLKYIHYCVFYSKRIRDKCMLRMALCLERMMCFFFVFSCFVFFSFFWKNIFDGIFLSCLGLVMRSMKPLCRRYFDT